MHQFHVIDTMQADRSIAFHDAAGAYHVARSGGALPNVGDTLKGAPPQPGAAVLVGRYGLLFDVVFDLVGVRQERAFDRLHGPVTP